MTVGPTSAAVPITGLNQPASNVTEFTVSELSFALKRTVEQNYEHVRVRGEISGFKGVAGSGHCYFRLKDDRACLEAVVWKTTVQRLRFKPQEGLEMVATGKLTTYPGRSSYQIVVEHLEPAGEGALMALLEERRRKLAGEGLFDQARKRPIPYLPRVIGVVTSPTGAVIRDILHRLRDRFPVQVLVWPVRVQGEGAAEEVAAAVRGFNALAPDGLIPRPDVLIVARGGGSIEDLWAFNEEVAVRAVAESAIPTIAAVGHETDWTLIDYAADLRAPTPTGAAEMAVPVRAELRATVRELASRHELAQRRALEARRREVAATARAMPSLGDLLALPRQKLDHSGERLRRSLASGLEKPRRKLQDAEGRLERSLGAEVKQKRKLYDGIGERLAPALLSRAQTQRRDRLDQRSERLRAAQRAALRGFARDYSRVSRRHDISCLARIVTRHREQFDQSCRLYATLKETSSPEAILAKGFALVRDGRGRTVRSPEDVSQGSTLSIQLASGSIGATVSDGEDAPLPKRTPSRRAATPPAAARKVVQGSLF